MTPRPWLPLLALLAGIGLVGLAGWAIDSSDLEQAPESWGFVFAAAIVTVFYAVWPVLVTLVTALLSTFATTPAGARRAAMFGAVTAAMFGAVGVVAGGLEVVRGGYAAEVVFGLAVMAAGVVPVLPLVRTLTGRSGDDPAGIRRDQDLTTARD